MKFFKDHKYLIDKGGVYEIFCLKNGKTYIGSTSTSFRKRFNEHNKTLKRNKHCNIHLQRAWNKYGDEFFEMRILETCTKDEIISREQFWIDTFQATKYGYNICEIAFSSIGIKRSEETKEKIRQSKIGKSPLISEEEKRSRRERQKLMMTPEAREKAMKTRKSRELTEKEKQTIEKLIKSNKQRIYPPNQKKELRQRIAKNCNINLLEDKEIIEIRNLYKIKKLKIVDIAKKLNKTYRTIYNIVKGATYNDVIS
jgi:group I intron endonuclease